jgi:hypothetical protein
MRSRERQSVRQVEFFLFRGIFLALISSRFNIATITRQLATL